MTKCKRNKLPSFHYCYSQDAFETLMLSLEHNKVIQDLDVRMTGVDAESLTLLRKRLDKNKGMNPHDTRIINPRFIGKLNNYLLELKIFFGSKYGLLLRKVGF